MKFFQLTQRTRKTSSPAVLHCLPRSPPTFRYQCASASLSKFYFCQRGCGRFSWCSMTPSSPPGRFASLGMPIYIMFVKNDTTTETASEEWSVWQSWVLNWAQPLTNHLTVEFELESLFNGLLKYYFWIPYWATHNQPCLVTILWTSKFVSEAVFKEWEINKGTWGRLKTNHHYFRCQNRRCYPFSSFSILSILCRCGRKPRPDFIFVSDYPAFLLLGVGEASRNLSHDISSSKHKYISTAHTSRAQTRGRG